MDRIVTILVTITLLLVSVQLCVCSEDPMVVRCNLTSDYVVTAFIHLRTLEYEEALGVCHTQNMELSGEPVVVKACMMGVEIADPRSFSSWVGKETDSGNGSNGETGCRRIRYDDGEFNMKDGTPCNKKRCFVCSWEITTSDPGSPTEGINTTLGSNDSNTTALGQDSTEMSSSEPILSVGAITGISVAAGLVCVFVIACMVLHIKRSCSKQKTISKAEKRGETGQTRQETQNGPETLGRYSNYYEIGDNTENDVIYSVVNKQRKTSTKADNSDNLNIKSNEDTYDHLHNNQSDKHSNSAYKAKDMDNHTYDHSSRKSDTAIDSAYDTPDGSNTNLYNHIVNTKLQTQDSLYKHIYTKV